MKIVFAVSKLLLALALVPFAMDWRSPLLFMVRPWALTGLIALPMLLILAQAWAIRTARSGQRTIKVLGWLGLLAAIVALSATLFLEARFHWERRQVLEAEPAQLERLGRHLIIGYQDLGEVRELLMRRAIAGVFLTTRNVRGKSIAQIQQEIRSLQDIRQEQGLPRLWIATDQEGGTVSRLSPPLTRLPALSEIVESRPDIVGQEQAIRQYASRQGRGLASLGINLNFAPVVDLNHQVKTRTDLFTRIFERAISSDPKVVARVAGWYCAGLEDAGVHCTLKHFPGLGRVLEDTHLADATLGASTAELTKTDWVPFRKLMSRTGAFTMLGHVRLTEVDREHPASFSRTVISGMLRRGWKYEGVLITDDFSMRAVYRSSEGIGNASVEALNAGVDLILVSWDHDQFYRVMYALLKADRQGRLDRETLQRSDERLARAAGLLPR